MYEAIATTAQNFDNLLKIDPATAIAIYQSELPGALDLLRLEDVIENRRAFSAGARVIKQCAMRPWKLKAYSERGFKIQTSQSTLMLNEVEFGALTASVCDKLLGSTDTSTVGALEAALVQNVSPSVIIRWTLALFLAHEFFHSAQRLDSDTYADSDAFINIVAAADYQADIVGIDYMFRCITRSLPIETHRSVLLLLILIHISVIQVFTPSAASMTIGRAAFDRLLLWHLQAARIAASTVCPDASHASLAIMPVVAFPGLEQTLGSTITWTNVKKRLGTRTSYQLVIALCGADHVIRIRRLHPTLKDRVPQLVHAVLSEDFSAFRDSAEEFFKTHDDLHRFDGVSLQYLRPAVKSCLASIGALVVHAEESTVSCDNPDVAASLDQVLDLAGRSDLPGPLWAEMQREIERVRNTTRLARTKAQRLAASEATAHELRRLEIRLNWALDQLGA